jgi:hypothetical protein
MSTRQRPSHIAQALLRVTVVRWLAAELLALGCLAIGITIAWLWRGPGAPLGFLIALIGGTIFTTYYLYKVLGASAGWAIPLTLLLLAATILGDVVAGNGTVTDSAHPGTHLVVTSTYWLALIALTGAIALTVAAAAASGEHWTRRHLPRDRFDAVAGPRASLAGLWRPASQSALSTAHIPGRPFA